MAFKPMTVALRFIAATTKMKEAALASRLARGSKAEKRRETAHSKAVDRAYDLREQLEEMGQAAMIAPARALGVSAPNIDFKAWVAAYRAQKAASERRRALPPGSSRARVTTANARWKAAAEEWTRISRDRSDIARLVEQLVDAEVVVAPKPDPDPPAARVLPFPDKRRDAGAATTLRATLQRHIDAVEGLFEQLAERAGDAASLALQAGRIADLERFDAIPGDWQRDVVRPWVATLPKPLADRLLTLELEESAADALVVVDGTEDVRAFEAQAPAVLAAARAHLATLDRAIAELSAPTPAKEPTMAKTRPRGLSARIAQAFASIGIVGVEPRRTKDGWVASWEAVNAGVDIDSDDLEAALQRELGDVLDFDGAFSDGIHFWKRTAQAPLPLPSKPKPKAKPKRTKAPARAAVRDRTRRELHQRAAKATANGTGPLSVVWHERAKVTASNGRVTSAFSADTPSACERWTGGYTRRGKAVQAAYPIADVRTALFVVGNDDDVDLRALKRLAKLAKVDGRPIGIVRKSGATYAVAGEPLVDGEGIRQDKALGAVVLAEQIGNRDDAIWVRADDLALALATAGQRTGRVRIPAHHESTDALLIEIDHLGESHAVRRVDAPAPTRVAVKLDPPPTPGKTRRPSPTEGQWAALTCKGGRVSVEHFDSQAQAEEYLAATDGPDWGYAAQIDAIFRA